MSVVSAPYRSFVFVALPVLAALAVIASFAVGSGPPTFHRDVLPILQRACQDCHRPNGLNLGGMVAPMAFTSFDEVLPWTPAIKLAVSDGRMPPWHASDEYAGRFTNERRLAERDKETLLAWIDGGAPSGDPDDAPPPRRFASDHSGWSIGEPDLVVRMPVEYLVRDDVEDEYVDFATRITADMLPEDRWIKAVEFRPGSDVVHHVIANPLGGIAPGYQPKVHPDGYGVLLRTGTTVSFQMHYHKAPGPGTAVYDRTEAAIVFYEPGEIIEHVVENEALGMFDFRIPAGEPSFSDSTSYTFRKDVKLLSMNPHMHLRGKAARYVARFPDGRREELLHVPSYDFNWQHTYYLAEPVFMPAGSQIHLTLWWDNSADNPSNPNPNRDVQWGRPTTDEMGFGFVGLTEVEPRHIVVGGDVPDDLPPRRPLARRRNER